MSIIIFEGVDNCGKTEISTAVVKHLLPDHKYFKVKQEQLHIQSKSHDVLREAHILQMNFFYELARQTDQNVVMDRFYPSEYVYGSLFRDIDEEVIWHYDKLFSELDVKIVILEKGDKYLQDELWTNEQLIAVREKYKEFASKTKCKVYVMNTESENLDEQLAELSIFLHD